MADRSVARAGEGENRKAGAHKAGVGEKRTSAQPAPERSRRRTGELIDLQDAAWAVQHPSVSVDQVSGKQDMRLLGTAQDFHRSRPLSAERQADQKGGKGPSDAAGGNDGDGVQLHEPQLVTQACWQNGHVRRRVDLRGQLLEGPPHFPDPAA